MRCARRAFRVGVVGMAALWAGNLGAQGLQSPPRFSYLASQYENSALSMECDGTPPFDSIRCHFTQVTVSPFSSSDAKSQEEALAEVDATPWEKLRPTSDQLCAGMGDPDSHLAPKEGTAKSAARARAMGLMKALCDCKGAECFRAQFRAFLGLERETCKVWTNSFDTDFKRLRGEQKWISNSEPEGLCNVVTVVVIELDPADRTPFGYKWRYTQTRLAADSTSPLCKGFELKRAV